MRLKRLGVVAGTVLLPGAFLAAYISEGQFDFPALRAWTFLAIIIWIASRISHGTGRRIGNRLALVIVSSWTLGGFLQPDRLWREFQPMLHPMAIPVANFIGLALLILMYWAETGALERVDRMIETFRVPIPRWVIAIFEVIATVIGWIVLAPLMLFLFALVLFPFAIIIFGVIAHILGVPLVLDAAFYEAFAAGVLLLVLANLIGNWPVGPKGGGTATGGNHEWRATVGTAYLRASTIRSK